MYKICNEYDDESYSNKKKLIYSQSQDVTKEEGKRATSIRRSITYLFKSSLLIRISSSMIIYFILYTPHYVKK